MPYSRPTLTQLRDRARSHFDSKFPGSDSRLRRSFFNILALALAGLVHGLYGFLAFIFKQLFPDTAEVEYLKRWAAIWGITTREATKASGPIVVTGTNGSAVPIDYELTRSDGKRFKITEAGVIALGEATVPVEALEAGVDGNTLAGSILSFVSTPTGVNNSATVDNGGIVGGTDIEKDESLLNRLLNRIQKPPQGGSEDDYRTWALEVPGVTRAWVYPLELGLGTVTVRFMMDDSYSDGIPQSGDVDDVQDYIDARRPVTADVTVVAPISTPRNFTIDLGGFDTPEARTAIEAELKDLLRRDGEPGGTIYLSRINEAISIALGEFDHVLSVPAANVTHTTGQIPTMGTITWL